MAEQTIKDESDRGSPQYVAYLLLQGIAVNEDKLNGGFVVADKEWVLTTYAQCLAVARGVSARDVLEE